MKSSPYGLEKRVKEEAPDTRVQCRMVSIRYLLKYENAREINPHGHCRLLDALWLFRHLMGERLGLRGDGCTYLRNQPCAIRIAHFREEKQKEKVCLFEKGCNLRAFSERRAKAPRARDFFSNGLALVR